MMEMKSFGEVSNCKGKDGKIWIVERPISKASG